MSLTLLIDADVLRYQMAFSNTRNIDWDGDGQKVEAIQPEKARVDIDEYIATLMDKFGADDYLMPLSCKVSNFRKDVYPPYKAGRHRKAKPALWNVLDKYIYETCASRIIERPGLEGDDILGILATHPSPKRAPGKRIVVSIDKDLQTIPCRLYNPGKPDIGVRPISEHDAALFWMKQVLTGDQVDEYPGCKGIGMVKADEVLMPLASYLEDQPVEILLSRLWERVVSVYESKGYTAADALVQARCARILRHGDYNYTTGKVNLWSPPT